jgi:hypothetical protein
VAPHRPHGLLVFSQVIDRIGELIDGPEVVRQSNYNRQVPARMHHDLLYALIISFAGAALFLLVDRYEPNHTMAALLKFLVLAVSSLAIMQRMDANWLSLF